MQPSFFSLFKRGKYYHRPQISGGNNDAASEQAKRECKELERFTVASVAFCLQHDDEFRNHFFTRICRLAGDPQLEQWNVDVEPHAWGDLIIRNKPKQGHFVYAVECKIGAFLEDHQNPDEDAFCKKGGYGRVLAAAEKGAVLRYVVLGYREPLNAVPTRLSEVGIHVDQRYWSAIVNDYNPTGITLDLFDSLGRLDIPEFGYRYTDNMKIDSKAIESAKSGQIITHASKRLGFLLGYLDLDAWYENENQWCFGYVVKKLPPTQGKSENQRKLMKLLKASTDDDELAWLGYEADSAKGRKLSVYFYSRDSGAIYSQLLAKFPETKSNGREDSNIFEVVVSTNDHKEPCDRDWFISVFEAVGLKELH
jgi:hypothetical protein